MNRRIQQGSRVRRIARSLHGAFRISISGPSLFTGPSPLGFLCLCAVYPALPFVSRPLLLLFLLILVVLVDIVVVVVLLVGPRRSLAIRAALPRDILSVLFSGTSGGWHADKGNLLSQEISGGKGVARPALTRTRLGLFACV